MSLIRRLRCHCNVVRDDRWKCWPCGFECPCSCCCNIALCDLQASDIDYDDRFIWPMDVVCAPFSLVAYLVACFLFLVGALLVVPLELVILVPLVVVFVRTVCKAVCQGRDYYTFRIPTTLDTSTVELPTCSLVRWWRGCVFYYTQEFAGCDELYGKDLPCLVDLSENVVGFFDYVLDRCFGFSWCYSLRGTFKRVCDDYHDAALWCCCRIASTSDSVVKEWVYGRTDEQASIAIVVDSPVGILLRNDPLPTQVSMEEETIAIPLGDSDTVTESAFLPTLSSGTIDGSYDEHGQWVPMFGDSRASSDAGMDDLPGTVRGLDL